MSNLLKRCIFGLLYGAVVFCGLYFEKAFAPLMIVLGCMAMAEFNRMASGGNTPRVAEFASYLAFFIVFGTVLLSSIGEMSPRYFVLGLIPVLAIPASAVFSRAYRQNLDSLVWMMAALVYIALPICLSPLLVYGSGEFNGLLMLGITFIIWLSDIGAYAIGTLLGQKSTSRKLAPEISPKKSWWGFAGALIFGIGTAAALKALGVFGFSYVHCLVLGALTSAAGVLGDLVESVFKRHFGLKDSGNVIPGHGGILDRIDSPLVAIPVAGLYLFIAGLL